MGPCFYWDGGGVREGIVGKLTGAVGIAGRGGNASFGVVGRDGNGGRAVGFGRFVAAGIMGRGLDDCGGKVACCRFGIAGICGIVGFVNGGSAVD